MLAIVGQTAGPNRFFQIGCQKQSTGNAGHFSKFLHIFSLTLWMMNRASKSVYPEQDQSLGYIGMIMLGHLFQEELPKPWMEG